MMPRRLLSLAPLLLLLLAACSDDDAYVDRMAEEHANDSTNATAIVQEPMIPVAAQSVSYGDGMTGYLAAPERPDSVLQAMGQAPTGALPAVVLVHEWWGLNDNIEAMARRLAGEGFRVLAVDLYGGEVAATPGEAQQIMGRVSEDPEAMMANIGQAIDHLRSQYETSSIGVMGWCFGGGVSLRTALNYPDAIDATVIYYGHVGDVASDRERLDQLDMPILGLFGGEDTGIPVETVRTFESTLEELGKNADIHVYEDAGHAFANPTGQNYVEEAAEDAWDKTTTFLRRTLYGSAAVGTDMDA